MLSYRHSYHAGNHADVLKHTVFVQLLRHLAQKEKPFWVIDTHAGAGIYALDSEHASKLAEYRDGIGRLWQRSDLPPAIADYVGEVKSLNRDGQLRTYPGSPWLALRALREHDRLRLFELHSTDHRLLAHNFSHATRQTIIYADDGFAGLKALLPPPSRRALTLIDPSYETAPDYRAVKQALKDALQRFATGTYAVWYPLLQKPEARLLPQRLAALGAPSWLHVTLTVSRPSRDGFGMHGSGMYIVNPAWTLEAALREAMPFLAEVLAQGEGAGFTLEAHSA